MVNPAPATELAVLFKAELKALTAFVSLLETEQQALVQGLTEQLPPLSENKTRAVHELNELDRQRRNLLLAQGATTNTDDLDSWLQVHAAECLPLWQEMRQLTGRLQELNRNNGMLIQTRLRQTQQALSVLQGAAASSAQGLYGADGQTQIASSGRILGSV